MLSERQITQFHRDGFLNAGKIIADEQLAVLGTDLDTILDKGADEAKQGEFQPVAFREFEAVGNERPVIQIINIWEASTAFKRLLYHPGIVQAVSQLTGFKDLQVWHDQIQYKPAGNGSPTIWHQDAPAWPSIEPMTPVSAWLPFDDADVGNGCMWMVPGSHQWGVNQEYLNTLNNLRSVEDFSRVGAGFKFTDKNNSSGISAVSCPVLSGEVHFHHSLTWHGSPVNVSGRRRRALAIHYMSSQSRYTGREHVMQQFIEIPTGEQMQFAGEHFPQVCKDGIVVEPVDC